MENQNENCWYTKDEERLVIKDIEEADRIANKNQIFVFTSRVADFTSKALHAIWI